LVFIHRFLLARRSDAYQPWRAVHPVVSNIDELAFFLKGKRDHFWLKSRLPLTPC
jgi:hypothetical protein